MIRRHGTKVLWPLTFLIVVGAVMEVVIRVWKVPDYLIPAPSAVVTELITSLPLLLRHLGSTLAAAALGFALGNLLAMISAGVFCEVAILRRGVYPIIAALQAVPILALAPYVSIWFGTGIASKAVIAAALCYFPATMIGTRGLLLVNRDALLLMQSMGASRGQVFRSLRIPSAVPAFVSAFAIAVPLCTVGAIVAEFSGTDRGIGYVVLKSAYEFRTVSLFAALTLVSIATLVMFIVVKELGQTYARRFTFSYAASTD